MRRSRWRSRRWRLPGRLCSRPPRQAKRRVLSACPPPYRKTRLSDRKTRSRPTCCSQIWVEAWHSCAAVTHASVVLPFTVAGGACRSERRRRTAEHWPETKTLRKKSASGTSVGIGWVGSRPQYVALLNASPPCTGTTDSAALHQATAIGMSTAAAQVASDGGSSPGWMGEHKSRQCSSFVCCMLV